MITTGIMLVVTLVVIALCARDNPLRFCRFAEFMSTVRTRGRFRCACVGGEDGGREGGREELLWLW